MFGVRGSMEFIKYVKLAIQPMSESLVAYITDLKLHFQERFSENTKNEPFRI